MNLVETIFVPNLSQDFSTGVSKSNTAPVIVSDQGHTKSITFPIQICPNQTGTLLRPQTGQTGGSTEREGNGKE
jgi:hypothetical protein